MHPCVFHNDSAKVRKNHIRTKFKTNYFSIIFEHTKVQQVHGARCANWPDIYEKYFR
jgi:hypothetical protein